MDVIDTKPLDECIHETARSVSGMIQDTKFRDWLGLSREVTERLTGLYMWEIRENVAEVYGANRGTPCVMVPADFEECKRQMAVRLQKSMRAFRAVEGLPEPDDDAADLESCLASVENVFSPKPAYRRTEEEIKELQKEIWL